MLTNLPSKIKQPTESTLKSKSKIRSIRDDSPCVNDNYQDGYIHYTAKEAKDRVISKKGSKKDKHVNITHIKNEKHKDITDFRVRSASNNKKGRYNTNSDEQSSPHYSKAASKFKHNYGDENALQESEAFKKVSETRLFDT